MTKPGSIVPPSPGWWVRSDHVGTTQGAYGWSGAAAGVRSPQGHTSGTYGWAGTNTHGLKQLPSFIGANAANAPQVTIPTHQIGDLIILFVYDGTANAIPVAPAASGTVPAWVGIDSGNAGVMNCASATAYFVATATTTTTGFWGNLDFIIASVIRNPGATPIGAHANTGGVATSAGPVAPALSLTNTDGSSIVLNFFGQRTGGGWSTYNAAPTGYTQWINSIQSGGGAVCLDIKNVTTTAPSVAQPVNADPTGAEYRGASIEVRAF